ATSTQRNIEPRTRRGPGFAVERPKVVGRSHREAGSAFKWRIPAPISAFSRANITARGTAEKFREFCLLPRAAWHLMKRGSDIRPLTRAAKENRCEHSCRPCSV